MIGFNEHSSAIVEPIRGNSDASVCQMLKAMIEVEAESVKMLTEGLISVTFVSPLNDRQFEAFAKKLRGHAHVAKKDFEELIR